MGARWDDPLYCIPEEFEPESRHYGLGKQLKHVRHEIAERMRVYERLQGPAKASMRKRIQVFVALYMRLLDIADEERRAA